MRDTPKAGELLAWYDDHARKLPWRVGPAGRRRGQRADPYQVWLSEIMLQQTTVAAVGPYFLRFLELWPSIERLAAAEDAHVMGEWAGLGYYARARNLLKCARIVASDHGGRFPKTRENLLKLPGIGPYTAAAIAAIAYDAPECVVDGNVERVMARLFLVETPLPAAKPELVRLAQSLTPSDRPGDYAQGVMDLGATLCTPRNPTCGLCPWVRACAARFAGRQCEVPLKLPKKAKPARKGIVYIARREDGAWLLETRPQNGLLGGMLGWPGSDWAETPTEHSPPIVADWRDPGFEVRHTLTHFHLRLALRTAETRLGQPPDRGRFMMPDEFRRGDLPTVMRKAFDLARTALTDG